MSDNILQRIADLKNFRIRQLITDFLGHEPSREERRKFSIMNRLSDSRIYYEGTLIGMVRNPACVELEG